MKRIVAVVALAVSAVFLAACSPTVEESPTPTPVETTTVPVQSETPTPSESPTPSPEPSPTPSETLDADQIAARDTVNEFFRLIDELAKDPEMSLQPLSDITTGQTREIQLDSVVRYRDMNAVQTGDTVWQFTAIGSAETEGGVIRIPVEACTDTTDVDMVDIDSRESVLPPDRAYFVTWQIDVSSENPGYWNVGDLTSQEAESCPV